MSFACVNGVSLQYDWRPGEGLPLVLLHEMGGTLRSWDLVLRALPGRAVLRLDLRGFGLSEKPTGALRMTDLAADVVALIDYLALPRVHLVGGAVGGGVALQTAARLGDRAAQVTALAPANGIPFERRAGTLAMAARLEKEGIHAFLQEDTIPKAWPEPRFDRTGDGFALFCATQASTPPATLGQAYRMLAETDLGPVISALACPALFVAGLHDIARPPALIEALAEMAPQGQFLAVDSGHFMALQDPELVASLL
ncbi:alpha/beta fold hydrolase [Pararhodobacter marinus]|uniref:alpha/beta fold hydrolase n=1 Tax=Pararhodobacter marinus TaxID=2184063 RepID=UPI003513AA2E